MNNHIALYLFGYFLGSLITVKMMSVFYEKRRTSFKVLLLSILLINIIFAVQHTFFRFYFTPYWMAAELPFVLAGYFIITLNYKSTVIKRIVVTVSTFTILFISSAFIAAIIQVIVPETTQDSDDLFNIVLHRTRRVKHKLSSERVLFLSGISLKNLDFIKFL